MSERSRNHLYTGLCTVVEDEEAVQEMLSHFPARDLDEPATRDHLRAGLAEVRAEMADVRAEITEVRAEITEVRAEITEVRAEITALEARMIAGFARADQRLAEEMAALRQEIRVTMRNWTLGGVGLLVAAGSAVAGLLQAVGS